MGASGWSGLSVLVGPPDVLKPYAGYDIYADTLLDEWLARVEH